MEVDEANVLEVEKMSKKLVAMNDQLDGLKELAHQLVLQVKVLNKENDTDLGKFLATPATRKPMITSTPVHTKVQSMPKWSSMDPAQQYEILREVANKHTKVSLDFEGLRQAIIASQRVVALKNTFGLGQASENQNPEEAAYVKELLDENIDLSKQLIDLMEEYLQAEITSMECKTKVGKKFCETQQLYATLNLEVNGDQDGNDDMIDSHETIVRKREILKQEEDKLQQMKIVIQKWMLSFPNLGLKFDTETNNKYRDIFARCGEDISKLRQDPVVAP